VVGLLFDICFLLCLICTTFNIQYWTIWYLIFVIWCLIFDINIILIFVIKFYYLIFKIKMVQGRVVRFETNSYEECLQLTNSSTTIGIIHSDSCSNWLLIYPHAIRIWNSLPTSCSCVVTSTNESQKKQHVTTLLSLLCNHIQFWVCTVMIYNK